MNKPFWRNIFLGIVLGLVAGVLTFYFLNNSFNAAKQLTGPMPLRTVVEASKPVIEEADSSVQSQASMLQEQFKSIVNLLKTSNSPEANFKALLELEILIKKLPKPVAMRAIVDFLNSKEDAITQLNFILDSNGFLEMAPTFRTFLLDQLAEVDSQAAQQYAKIILETPGSADEWAVALRNYAWANNAQGLPHDDPYFHERLNLLLNNKDWLKNPSTGFLQAFDAVVYSNDVQFVPRLAQLAIPDASDPAVEYAARLALTRMADQDFAHVAYQLINDAELKNQPELRASILNRADLSESADYNTIEDYLNNSNISADEKGAFIDGYPSIIDMHSYNLLTKQHSKPLSRNKISDLKTLEMYKKMKADPRNKNIEFYLDQGIRRMEEYVASFKRGEEQDRQRAATSSTPPEAQ